MRHCKYIKFISTVNLLCMLAVAPVNAAPNRHLGFDRSIELAQGQQDKWKSEAEVVQQVQRKMDARVLKIRLDRSRKLYRVKLLMSNGRVRNISVSAVR